MKKNPDGWKLRFLFYDPGVNETYVVCGKERLFYTIPGVWTPETMLEGLKKLHDKENENRGRKDIYV